MSAPETIGWSDKNVVRHGPRLSDTEKLRLVEKELVRLRKFVQFVANCSNDPGVVAEARRHGAE